MILVTGSNGFIGSHMVKGLSDLSGDAVVHMAAIADTTCCNWINLRSINIDWTLQIAEDCRRQGIPFLYASSASVYGNGDGPLNPYAWSKWIVDQSMIGRSGRWYGLRFFNVWGDEEDHKGKQASIIHRLRNGLDEIWEPDVKRDFIHVSDCVSVARWMIISHPPSGIYDVGTGNPVSFRELADKYGNNPRIVRIPDELRTTYQYDTKADLRRLRDAGYSRPFKKAV